MWTISELSEHNITLSKVAVGVVPFGTGNDFARTLGWGASAPSEIVGTSLRLIRL